MICCNLSVSAMLRGVFLFSLSALLSLTLLASQAVHAEPRKIPAKGERSYISGGLVLNEFRSIGFDVVTAGGDRVPGNNFPMTAQTYGLYAAYGSYITENFKTEIRYGRGVREDTLDKLVEINLNHWFSWYMGATYPTTEDLSVYALYGVSFYEADMIRREDERSVPIEGISGLNKVRASSTLDDDFFETNFSTSWMLGLDYRIENGLYLAFEYGRLLRDTETNFKVYQAGIHLRYEY